MTQGSKNAFVNKYTGRAQVRESGGAKHKSWREAVASTARQWQVDNGMPGQITGPVIVKATFALQRAASAPKRIRTRPIKARSGDIDKLLRAILDSLTGPLLADDSQVIGSVPFKDFGDPPGVVVEIYTENEFDDFDWCPAPLPQDVGSGLAEAAAI